MGVLKPLSTIYWGAVKFLFSSAATSVSRSHSLQKTGAGSRDDPSTANGSAGRVLLAGSCAGQFAGLRSDVSAGVPGIRSRVVDAGFVIVALRLAAYDTLGQLTADLVALTVTASAAAAVVDRAALIGAAGHRHTGVHAHVHPGVQAQVLAHVDPEVVQAEVLGALGLVEEVDEAIGAAGRPAADRSIGRGGWKNFPIRSSAAHIGSANQHFTAEG